MNIRYESFLSNASPEALYPYWLEARLSEWAETCERGVAMKEEKKNGWNFPILCSEQNHKDFDAWLVKTYPIKANLKTREADLAE